METLEAEMINREDEIIEERKKTIEAEPFKNPAVQSLFYVLCEYWVGKGFDVRFVPRSNFEKKETADTKAENPEKEVIVIPDDVRTSEMENILESAGRSEDERATRRQVETPENELVNFLFRKGNKLLEQNMPYDSLKRYVKNSLLSWKGGETTLREAFRVEEIKAELDEAKKTGDIIKIVDKEIEIVDKVQMILKHYPFMFNSQHPAKLIEDKKINCRGGSLLGGAILSEIGIKYLVGDVPKHSILVLHLSDDTLEWRDMTAPDLNEFIGEGDLTGVSKTGAKLTLADAIAYAKEPTPDGVMFDIANDKYHEKLSWVKKGGRMFLTLFPPGLGSQMQVLNGVAFARAELGHDEKDPAKKRAYFSEAVEACKLSTAYEPKYEYAYNTMGEALCNLGKYQEAIDSYQKSFEVNPMNTACHFGFGEANFALGRKKEATLAYEKYLELADKSEPDWMTEKAKKIIAESKK